MASFLTTGFALGDRPELRHVLFAGVGGYGGCEQRPSNEWNTSTSLKTIASVQLDPRTRDRDWNRVNDSWTADWEADPSDSGP